MMKEHTQKVAKFCSSLKALLYSLGLTSTDEIDEFLGSENPSTLDQTFLRKLFKLEFRDGFFLGNLRHLCCSENEPVCGQGFKLVAESYVGEEGFCYHTALSPDLVTLYEKLIQFCQTSLHIQSSKIFPSIFGFYFPRFICIFNLSYFKLLKTFKNSSHSFYNLMNYNLSSSLKLVDVSISSTDASIFITVHFQEWLFSQLSLPLESCSPIFGGVIRFLIYRNVPIPMSFLKVSRKGHLIA